ncbi:MAG: PD-(D/E)XK nuclease family protein [Clostridia bacterium]|nr:PD-(D/E)XK nuclease family protein [Clostridia bacterium]
MLKIITSNTANCAMQAVIDSIMVRGVTSDKHVVIVPDAYSLSAEKAILERLDLQGSMNIEVVSFTRFAVKTLGSQIGACLSKEGAVLVFKKVINKNLENLHHYRKAALSDGFAGETYAVIASIRNNGISVEEFEEALSNLEGSTLSKAKDLLVLYREYMKELGSFNDSTTQLDAFINKLPSDENVAKTNVYLFGFDSLSQKQIEIIGALATYAKSVTIGLMDSNGGANRNLYPYGVIERLLDYCELSKIEVDKEERRIESIREPFNTIHRNLFAVTDTHANDVHNAVTLFKEADVYAEYNAVAREINRLVRREGYRYNDIVVIDADGSTKQDLKEIFTRYGIPHFIDERYPLTYSIVYKFIASCLEVARYGFRADKVRALIKNPLFINDYELVADYDNHIVAKNLNYGDFLKEGELIYEPIRKKVTALAEGLVGTQRPVKSYVYAINAILNEPGFSVLFEDALEGVDDNLVALNRQALERFNSVLEEYVKLIGEEHESVTGFSKMLSSSCTAEEIALIPRYVDAVYVGALRESAVLYTKAIFIINATYDLLPANHGYQAIISALDADRLEKGGVRLYPTPIDHIREERFAFIDLVTKTEKLYIGYPETSIEATQNKPSEIIKEISQMLNKKVNSLNARFTITDGSSVEEQEDAVGSQSNAFYTYLTMPSEREVLKDVYATLSTAEKAFLADEGSGDASVPMLYTFENKGILRTEVSQLEAYFNCPYSHFLRYGLRLKERVEGKLKVVDVGNLIHNALEYYFKFTLGKLRSMSKEARIEAEDRALIKAFEDDSVKALYNNPSVAYLLANLRKDARTMMGYLTENVLKGSFDPAYIELKFASRGGDIDTIYFDTPYGKIAMHGKIDRIDLSESPSGKKLAIAVDYKTGHIASELQNVYYGSKIQLYVYLLAVKELLNAEPAGAFYLSTRGGYSSKGRNVNFQGQIVGSAEVVEALDKPLFDKLKQGEKLYSDIIPKMKLQIKEDGRVYATSKDFITDKEMQNAIEYVKELIVKAVDEIAQGNIEKSPLKKCSEYCPYRDICGGVREDQIRTLQSKASPTNYDKGEING